MGCRCGNVPCRHIVITNNNCDESVTVTQPLIGTIEVTAVGPRGASGPAGSPGTSGANGSSGSSGTSGASGASGSSGTSGASGASGSSGTSGASGASGSSGTSGASGAGADPGNINTNVYLTPINLTCQSGVNIDLSDSAYNTTGMFKLDWTGNSGNMTLTLPDCTLANNTNRAIRFISDGTYATNTRTYLTPANGQTLDGSTDYYEINKAYEGIMVWSDGTEWFRIQTKA